MQVLELILAAVAAGAVGLVVGYFIRKYIAEARIVSAEEAAKKIIEEANSEAQAIKREKRLEAKEEVHRLRHELDKEIKERRNELQRIERRLQQKEESLDRKTSYIERKEEELRRKEEENRRLNEKLSNLQRQQLAELERISGLTTEEAKEVILQRVQEEVSHEMAALAKEIESQAKADAEKKAREIVTMAIQRCAADHATGTTVSVVNLPNDEMKGRIIGREGRNIRTL
ncbi:MAG TPA: Rnase Y domain-containing protein, partial [Bacillota bacterium]|nr:Rnase Y domain-containing protein [Bacillota bacterium]